MNSKLNLDSTINVFDDNGLEYSRKKFIWVDVDDYLCPIMADEFENNSITKNKEYKQTAEIINQEEQHIIETLSEKCNNINKKLDNIYTCSITYQKMKDPVITPSGQMYDRKNIEKWIKKNGTDPYTRRKLEIKQLIPVRVLKE